jgi:hypothetical protein
VRGEVVLVDPAVPQDQPQQAVHQGEVRAGPDGQVHVGLAGDRRRPRVDGEHRRRVGPVAPVQHPHPEHCLRLGDVVPPQRDRVAVVHVGVGAGLTVGAEAGLERRRRRGGAQPGVAVHVGCAQASLADHGERVVLLEEELAGGVEAEPAPTAGLGQQRFRPGDDPVHRLVPAGLDEPVAVADQRPGQPVGAGVGLPAVDVLGVEPAPVDPVCGAAAHPDDPAVAHPDVDSVAVGVQQRRRLHPALRPFDRVFVHPHRPRIARTVRRSRSPGFRDPVRIAHADRITTRGVGQTPPNLFPSEMRSRTRWAGVARTAPSGQAAPSWWIAAPGVLVKSRTSASMLVRGLAK